MRTPAWKPEKLTVRDGIQYTLFFEPEHELHPREHLIGECDWSTEQYKEIADCYFFSVEIKAEKGGYHLASNYLGGCCYSSKSEVMGDSLDDVLGGQAIDMIKDLKEEAKAELDRIIDQTKSNLMSLLK